MVTADEIGSIAIFVGLDEADRERLARAAADITLAPGEYAAHEGGERALLAVLDGRIEVVKLVDGIQRVIGERQVGDIFGEVPIVLGTFFRSASARPRPRASCGSSRTTTTPSPPSSRTSPRKSASSQPSGCRGRVASRASPPSLRLHGRSSSATAGTRPAVSCATSSTATRSASSGSRRTPPRRLRSGGGVLPDDGDLPTIRVVDGKTVVRPQLRRVAELLDVATEPAAAEYDTVILGAGPAGLAAAVYGASEGLRTVVVEREAPGGQAGTSSRIENYLGFPSGVSGTSSRAARSSRRGGSAPRSSSPGRSPGSIPRRAKSTSTAATSCGRGRSSSRAG
jgi:thioredoxin reductase (NADPH)